METPINIKEFTRLPADEIARGDSPGRALHVQTPHKGEVVIEYHSKGFMHEHNEDMGLLLRKLRDLDYEAKEYLLGQWLTEFYRPIKSQKKQLDDLKKTLQPNL